MKFTKKQIRSIKTAHNKAVKAEAQFMLAMSALTNAITTTTGIDGNVDFLQGDGFGFEPNSCENNTHIPVEQLIELAETGEITEKIMLDNLSI